MEKSKQLCFGGFFRLRHITAAVPDWTIKWPWDGNHTRGCGCNIGPAGVFELVLAMVGTKLDQIGGDAPCLMGARIYDIWVQYDKNDSFHCLYNFACVGPHPQQAI